MSQYMGQVVCGGQSSPKSNSDVNPKVAKQTSYHLCTLTKFTHVYIVPCLFVVKALIINM